ncbi:MAG: hypothetical protein ACK5S9_06970 [Roseiflexaceae bacterium]
MNAYTNVLRRVFVFAVFVVSVALLPASAQANVVVSPRDYPSGFNDQFTNSASNWGIIAGRWTYGGGVLRGNGIKNGWSKAVFSKATYANFDYMVKMRRTGCSNCPNQIILRNTTNGAVYFGYDNTGWYRVYGCSGGRCVTWQDWTATTAIIPGGYNVLRVVAVRETYQVYINNRRVTQGRATGYTSGSGGLTFFSWVTAGNYLDIDYAILTRK